MLPPGTDDATVDVSIKRKKRGWKRKIITHMTLYFKMESTDKEDQKRSLLKKFAIRCGACLKP